MKKKILNYFALTTLIPKLTPKFIPKPILKGGRWLTLAFLMPLMLMLTGVSITHLQAQNTKSFTTKDYKITVKRLFRNLYKPWGFDFLPSASLANSRSGSSRQVILTEKNGRVSLLNLKTRRKKSLGMIEEVEEVGQGGLMDVLVHPKFSSGKPYIYFSLTAANKKGRGYATLLLRYEFKGGALTGKRVLFWGRPFSTSGRHFGSRLRIDKNGFLYLSLGERGNRPQSQDLKTHYGKVIRLYDDGRVPEDNPFIGENALPEIFTYGHRNPQGMALHPKTGEIWVSEHGARGGDEINVLHSGDNYGWPIISYGRHYIGTKIGEGTAKPGLEQPVFYWDPSIAPGGMSFYSGTMFPKWQSSLFVASLKFGLLSRLELNNEKVINEERIFRNNFGRIRDVKESPSGSIMFITDERDGGFYEITLSK